MILIFCFSFPTISFVAEKPSDFMFLPSSIAADRRLPLFHCGIA